ncbi:phage baseplate assembly protein V [Cupriavidus metallidurans]|uniref:phage baseplate assembly protein V n=1 Tax=Cupriavidus metallidurans TaxID=119219 RepID=UPI000493270B|nr:phage baseplate assembly protein V [Cupriavidus metallidurans]MDE4918542.1 phage baseplate assembly protein V [Cupriavidus metallidurans]
MSVPQLANILRAHAQMAQGEKTTHRVGQITAYDPNKYAVRVKFWPDTVESSGWIPLASTYVGAGWGLVAAPSIGDQVIVAFDREDQDAGVVVGRFFTDVEQPPAAPSGEFWLVHKSGSLLKFHNDGSVELQAAGTMKYTATQHHFVGPVLMDNTLTGNGGIAISGDNGSGNASTITGNLNTTGTITNNGHRIDSTHQHINSGGSGLGGVPQ